MAVTKATLLAAAEAKAQLRKLTDNQAVALVKAWVDTWDDLQPVFAEAIADLVAAGGTITRAQAARNRKLRAALEQIRATLDALTPEMDDLVINDVLTAVIDAAAAHEKILTTQLPPGSVGVSIDLDAPAPDALRAIVARTSQQIHKATQPLPKWVAASMKRELVRGIVVGDNPRKVAQQILKDTERAFNGGLARALNIARTEMLDAHRAGSLASAKTNKDILTGWIWMCTLDKRVCPSCLAKHGSEHPVDEFGPIDHHSGRCARVDKTKTWADLGFTGIDEPADATPDARAWYDNLDEESQLAIMGPTRRQLLADGKIQWDDLATTTTNTGWRDSITPTPVKDLQAKADAA